MVVFPISAFIYDRLDQTLSASLEDIRAYFGSYPGQKVEIQGKSRSVIFRHAGNYNAENGFTLQYVYRHEEPNIKVSYLFFNTEEHERYGGPRQFNVNDRLGP